MLCLVGMFIKGCKQVKFREVVQSVRKPIKMGTAGFRLVGVS